MSPLLEEIERRELLQEGIVAALLVASEKPVQGRTRLVKYIYLFQNELEKKNLLKDDGFTFIPYYHGPFSNTIPLIIRSLVEVGFIEEKATDVPVEDGIGKRYDYKPGDIERLKSIVKKAFGEKYEEVLQIARNIREKWDSKTLMELLDYVYNNTSYAEIMRLF